MEIIKISIIILIAVILINTLPLYDKNISSMITISTCVIVMVYVVHIIRPAFDTIKSIINNETNIDFVLIFKCMGISLITQFVADIASDSGNKALANQMIFVGKLAIVILAMPIFVKVLEIIGQFIK